jgi:hypothetical protein
MRWLAAIARGIVALLRELADERAYERYLVVTGRAASGEEWRRFSDERLRRKYSHGRCC